MEPKKELAESKGKEIFRFSSWASMEEAILLSVCVAGYVCKILASSMRINVLFA